MIAAASDIFLPKQHAAPPRAQATQNLTDGRRSKAQVRRSCLVDTATCKLGQTTQLASDTVQALLYTLWLPVDTKISEGNLSHSFLSFFAANLGP